MSSPPVEFRIRFTDARRADAASFIPTALRLDGKTVTITHSDYVKAYHGFLAAVMCATSVSLPQFIPHTQTDTP